MRLKVSPGSSNLSKTIKKKHGRKHKGLGHNAPSSECPAGAYQTPRHSLLKLGYIISLSKVRYFLLPGDGNKREPEMD